MTIAASGTAADDSLVVALPIDNLMENVASVDDAELGASLTSALNAIITVNSTAAERVTTTRMLSVMCPRGFWCTAGLTVECEVGFYNPTLNANNQSACLRCPEHATTFGPNSTQKSQCVCGTNYFRTGDVSDSAWCNRCPVGTSCNELGSTLRNLNISVAYYRPSATSIDVRMCADAAANCSGKTVCAHSTSGCAGGSNPDKPCRDGLEGHFCGVCANASDQVRYYVGASKTAVAGCKACSSGMMSFLVLGALATLAVLACALATARWLWRHRLKDEHKKLLSFISFIVNQWRIIADYNSRALCVTDCETHIRTYNAADVRKMQVALNNTNF